MQTPGLREPMFVQPQCALQPEYSFPQGCNCTLPPSLQRYPTDAQDLVSSESRQTRAQLCLFCKELGSEPAVNAKSDVVVVVPLFDVGSSGALPSTEGDVPFTGPDVAFPSKLTTGREL